MCWSSRTDSPSQKNAPHSLLESAGHGGMLEFLSGFRGGGFKMGFDFFRGSEEHIRDAR